MTRIHPQPSTVFRPMTRNLLLLCTVLLAACGKAPTVSVFTSAPGTIAKGTSAKLVFSAEGEDKLTLDQGVGDVTGKTEVEVKPEQTTTYTLTATNGSGNATQTVTITVGPTPAAGFKITAADTFTAGTPADVTVTAVDPSGATVPSYTGTVHLVSNDGAAELPADFSFTAADKGVKTVPVTFRTAGSRQLIASGTVGGGMPGSFSTTSSAFTVKAGAASKLSLAGLPSEVESGTEVTFQVSFADAFGNAASEYETVLNVSLSEEETSLPAVTVTAADQGTATLRVTLSKSGVRTLTVQDTHNDTVKASAEVRVRPGTAAIACTISDVPATATAGTLLPVRVTVRDAFGNTATRYNGTMTLTATDAHPQALLPEPAAYSPGGDQGSRVFATRLVTAGSQTITATDATGGWSCTAQVTINPAAPQIHVMLPTDANASHPVEATVSVKDTYGNAISYAGTLSFSSTDTAAVLPADLTLAGTESGTSKVTATFNTLGAQELKATLVGEASLSGSGTTAVHGFVYTDPTPGMGKLRFVLNTAASSASVVQLDLVSNTTVIATASGTNVRGGVYSAGMNLPLDHTRVMADSNLLVEASGPGSVFNLGSAPKAVAAALPTSGPTAGVLYTGVSQKFDGAGKAIGDVSITIGYRFYSVRLKLPATATVGSVFNGVSLDKRFRAAVRNRAGDEVFSNADFAIGNLEVR
jgi:hypothetical protein